MEEHEAMSTTVFNWLHVDFIQKLNFLKHVEIRLVSKYGPRGHKTGGR